MARPDDRIKRLVKRLKDARMSDSEKIDNQIESARAAAAEGVRIRNQKELSGQTAKQRPSDTSGSAS